MSNATRADAEYGDFFDDYDYCDEFGAVDDGGANQGDESYRTDG